MTDPSLTRYEVRWGDKVTTAHCRVFSELNAALGYQYVILSIWAGPGDVVEVVKLKGISAETISRKVKGATPV